MCLGGRFLQKYAYKHPTPCCTLHLQALYTFQPKLLHARGRGWGARTGGTKKSSKPRVWFKFITDPTQQGISPPSGVKEREEETSYSYCTPSQQSTLVLLLHTQVHIQEKWVHWPLRRYALSRVLAGALFIQTNKQSPQKQGIKLFFFFLSTWSEWRPKERRQFPVPTSQRHAANLRTLSRRTPRAGDGFGARFTFGNPR